MANCGPRLVSNATRLPVLSRPPCTLHRTHNTDTRGMMRPPTALLILCAGAYADAVFAPASKWELHEKLFDCVGTCENIHHSGLETSSCSDYHSGSEHDAPPEGWLAGTGEACNTITTWDTSGVTTMFELFYRAEAFNADVSAWDVSNVVTMKSMFDKAKSFNQDISAWNVTSVTNMRDSEYCCTQRICVSSYRGVDSHTLFYNTTPTSLIVSPQNVHLQCFSRPAVSNVGSVALPGYTRRIPQRSKKTTCGQTASVRWVA